MSAFVYHNQAVRDLAWSCFSPSLFMGEALAAPGQALGIFEPLATPERLEWLLKLDRDPSKLLHYLTDKPATRLGIYFERLWQFFLIEDPQFELVAHNLPVRDAGSTVGEFDIICWCHQRNTHVHLELAVKFYLGHSSQRRQTAGSRWRDWLGPNARDRLDIKLDRMRHQQTRLAELPQASAQLADIGVEGTLSEVVIKGHLFTPIQQSLSPPLGYNPRAQMQRWVSIDKLTAAISHLSGNYFLPLPKTHWLSLARADSIQACVSRTQLPDTLTTLLTQTNGRPQLAAALNDKGQELYRFFTTTQDWPYNRVAEPLEEHR
ncbi:MAG: DUF1853 family protein [Pseudomonadota bacterium]